jgi:hypothetical protein
MDGSCQCGEAEGHAGQGSELDTIVVSLRHDASLTEGGDDDGTHDVSAVVCGLVLWVSEGRQRTALPRAFKLNCQCHIVFPNM